MSPLVYLKILLSAAMHVLPLPVPAVGVICDCNVSIEVCNIVEVTKIVDRYECCFDSSGSQVACCSDAVGNKYLDLADCDCACD